jgi:PAS domain S-box-containing protein
LTSYNLNLAALPWAVMSLALLVLSGMVYMRQHSSRVARLFCAMIALVALWFIGFAGMLSTTDPERAAACARFAIAAVCLIPASIYDFTVTALRLMGRRRATVAAVWIIASLFSLVTLTTFGVVDGVWQFSWGFYPRWGALRTTFLVFFGAVMVSHYVDYVLDYIRTQDVVRKRRLRDLIISFSIAYFAALDFIPMFGVDWRPLGYIPVAVFLLTGWQAIHRHRLRTITAASAAREVLHTMADALFVLDDEGKIRIVNDAVRSIFGFDEGEIVGKSINYVELVDPEESLSRSLNAMLRRGTIRDQERVFKHKDGHHIDVSVSISPLNEPGVNAGAVVIVRDIRERKRVEEELRAFTERLQQSNRELEDFAYVASHDLQEPLRKIQAFSDRLLAKHAGSLAPEGIDYLGRVQSAAKRMQVLINDLLAFSRVTTKGQPFVKVDLARVAHEVMKDLEIRIHQAHGHVTIDGLPAIDADPLQMRQLLQNLLGNALKFHRPGISPSVTIRGEIIQAVAGADWHADGKCRIIVSDNGIGFEEKYAERIFTMFERLHGRGSYEGTGIGLAICRKIAQRHRGDIIARSRTGEGATFIVTLPVHQPEGAIAHLDELKPVQGEGGQA